MFEFLSAVAPVTLTANPLAQAVAQIKFSTQSALSNPQGAALFHDLVADQYPRLLTEQQQTITAGPGGLTTTATPQWRLTDLDAKWACVIGPEQVALETSRYSDWSEMRGRLKEILVALTEVTKIRVRERVGLRYINHIKAGEDGSFADRISADLLGIAARPGWAAAINASLMQTVFKEENAQLVIRAGTGASIIEPEGTFVVDIDCFEETATNFDPEGTLDRLEQFNDVAYRCFCACVPESFRTTLK